MRAAAEFYSTYCIFNSERNIYKMTIPSKYALNNSILRICCEMLMQKSQVFSDQLYLHEIYMKHCHFINNCDMYFKSHLKQ